MKPRTILTILFILSSIGFAEAAGEPPAGPPKPPAEMAQLKIFEGVAKCTGSQSVSDLGPEHPTAAVVRGRSDIGGFEVIIRYNERKTKDNPSPILALYVIGYDASAKQFVSTRFDNFGGQGSGTAPGWASDKLTLTSDYVVGGKKLGLRDTFTKKSDTEVDHLGEIQGSDGKWTTLDQETCKR